MSFPLVLHLHLGEGLASIPVGLLAFLGEEEADPKMTLHFLVVRIVPGMGLQGDLTL